MNMRIPFGLKVLYTKGLGREDAMRIVDITKNHLSFSKYEFEHFEIPKEIIGNFPYLVPHEVITPQVTSWLEKREGGFIAFLTEKPIAINSIDPEGHIYIQFGLGYASIEFFNKKIKLGRIAIASAAGLGKKYIQRTAGTLLHELGELFIPFNSHCENENCFMYAPEIPYLFSLLTLKRFYYSLDKQNKFCDKCKLKIKLMAEEREKSEILDEERIKNLLEKLN